MATQRACAPPGVPAVDRQLTSTAPADPIPASRNVLTVDINTGIVTGGASGVGAATVWRLAYEKSPVIPRSNLPFSRWTGLR